MLLLLLLLEVVTLLLLLLLHGERGARELHVLLRLDVAVRVEHLHGARQQAPRVAPVRARVRPRPRSRRRRACRAVIASTGPSGAARSALGAARVRAPLIAPHHRRPQGAVVRRVPSGGRGGAVEPAIVIVVGAIVVLRDGDGAAARKGAVVVRLAEAQRELVRPVVVALAARRGGVLRRQMGSHLSQEALGRDARRSRVVRGMEYEGRPALT